MDVPRRGARVRPLRRRSWIALFVLLVGCCFAAAMVVSWAHLLPATHSTVQGAASDPTAAGRPAQAGPVIHFGADLVSTAIPDSDVSPTGTCTQSAQDCACDVYGSLTGYTCHDGIATVLPPAAPATPVASPPLWLTTPAPGSQECAGGPGAVCPAPGSTPPSA